MKIKILKNVIIGTKVQKAGAVLDVDRRVAGTLIEREYAEEVDGAPERPKQQQGQQPPPEK